MTSQEYIDAEVSSERNRQQNNMAWSQQAQAACSNQQSAINEAYGAPQVPEVILLRAKVRELTDKLNAAIKAERLRCANVAAGWPTGSTIGREISCDIMLGMPAPRASGEDKKPTTSEEAVALGYVPAGGGHRMFWYQSNGIPVPDKMLVLYMRGEDFLEFKVPMTDAEYADLLTHPIRLSDGAASAITYAEYLERK